MFSNFFADLQEDLKEIVDLPQPDTTPHAERLQHRQDAEQDDFDEVKHPPKSRGSKAGVGAACR